MLGTAEKETAERKTSEAHQADGEISVLRGTGRRSDWTLHSSKRGCGQGNRAEGEGGKHTYYLAKGVSRLLRWQQPGEVKELCSDGSSFSASSKKEWLGKCLWI